MTGLSMAPVTYDAIPFALASVWRAMSDLGIDPHPARAAIARLIRDPRYTAIVCHPTGHTQDYVGWAIGNGEALVYVYVRKAMRRMGIGSQLITEVTDTVPIRCAFWSRSFSRMAKGGIPLQFDLDLQSDILKFAR